MGRVPSGDAARPDHARPGWSRTDVYALSLQVVRRRSQVPSEAAPPPRRDLWGNRPRAGALGGHEPAPAAHRTSQSAGARSRRQRHQRSVRPLAPARCPAGGRSRYRLFGPMTASESQVAISGKMHIRITATIIRPTNGITPQITSRSGISGAMFLMTKIFSPTGGGKNPLPIKKGQITPKQKRTKPGALRGRRVVRAVRTKGATGGREKTTAPHDNREQE